MLVFLKGSVASIATEGVDSDNIIRSLYFFNFPPKSRSFRDSEVEKNLCQKVEYERTDKHSINMLTFLA